jgi:hypothetical protein
MITHVFAFVGLVLTILICLYGVVCGFWWIADRIINTATRIEIRERKRLKRMTNDHYAALLERGLYGRVLTGGNKYCDHLCKHPEVEAVPYKYQLPIPPGYPGYYEPHGFPERVPGHKETLEEQSARVTANNLILRGR